MRPLYVVLLVTVAAWAVGVIVVVRAGGGSGSLHAETTAPAARFRGAELPPGVRAPDFRLRDQDGKLVTAASLRGGPAVVTFLYTHCRDTCPITAQQVKGALDDLGRPSPQAIAISVDPASDTPASARAFLRRVGMTGRMRFLLGTRAELRRVWKGFAVRPQGQHEEHQARLVILDARGIQRVGFPVSQATPERIAHDLRALGAS